YTLSRTAAGENAGDGSTGSSRCEDPNDQPFLAPFLVAGSTSSGLRALILRIETHLRGKPRFQRRRLDAVGHRQCAFSAPYKYGVTVSADVEQSYIAL